MRILISAFAMALLAGTLQAGDWTGFSTGFHAGAQAGQHIGDDGADEARVTHGMHGGYDIGFPGLVLGPGMNFNPVRRDRERDWGVVRGREIQGWEKPGPLNFLAGRSFGKTLAYAITGGAKTGVSSGKDTGAKNAEAKNADGNETGGNETGVNGAEAVYGLGLMTAVGDNLTLSGEVLRQVFGNLVNSGSSARSDRFNMRVSFHF